MGWPGRRWLATGGMIKKAAAQQPDRRPAVAQASGAVSTAPASMAPPASAPAYSWNGCYLAAGAGAGMFNDEHHLAAYGAVVGQTQNSTTGGNGLVGRFGAGCDYQVASRIVVVGAFGNVDLSNMAGTMSESGIIGKETEHWAWSIGARAGYLL